MTKSTITREESVQAVFDLKAGYRLGFADVEILKRVARMALAAMDSEPVRNPVLSYADSYRDMAKQGAESVPIWSVITDLERNIAPLYRHAQQPVVPDDVLDALQKVARIRLDMNEFDGDRRGIADCLGDAEEALIEVVNRRAAMLQAGTLTNEDTKQAWTGIPDIDNAINMLDRIDTLESCDDDRIEAVKTVLRRLAGNSPVIPDGYVIVPKLVTPEIGNAINEVGHRCTCGNCSQRLWDLLLASAQQEVKGD